MADRLESDLFREDEGSEPQSGWTNTADGAPFGEKDLSAQSDTAFSYGYSQLSGDEEQLYREILNRNSQDHVYRNLDAGIGRSSFAPGTAGSGCSALAGRAAGRDGRF